MKITKSLLLCILSVQFLFQVPFAAAAPPENELNQYLAEIGWTKEELLEYLDFYEIPLDDFSSVEELSAFLGTPINAANYQDLLNKYGMTDAELQDLLNHFGDSKAEYKFIEDLEISVDFYVNHDEYMAEIENELADMGITEEEAERFFEYLAQVEENNQSQLDQMYAYDSRLEKFMEVEDTTELTDEELDELVQILTETMDLYQVKLQFKLDNKEITLKDLLKMEDVPANLFTSIYSTAGELLIDFTIPADFFDTGEVIDEGEEMIHIGELSNEYTDYLHEEKYEDAKNQYK